MVKNQVSIGEPKILKKERKIIVVKDGDNTPITPSVVGGNLKNKKGKKRKLDQFFK